MAESNALATFVRQMLESSLETEVEKNLSLFQVFLNLYEHHRELLDTLLDSEARNREVLSQWPTSHYIQGVANGEYAYLITNLVGGKTRALRQRQFVWGIGRDRHMAVCIPETQISRLHAAIQYQGNQGFHLIDLGSRNGSYVNGMPITYPHLLQDGDRVRLGSVLFTFFVCDSAHKLDEAPPQLLAKLEEMAMQLNYAPSENFSPSDTRIFSPVDGVDRSDFSFDTTEHAYLNSGPS